MHNFPKIDIDSATFVKYNLTDSYRHHSCNMFNLQRFTNVWKNCCLCIHDISVTSTKLRHYIPEAHNLNFLLPLNSQFSKLPPASIPRCEMYYYFII